MTSRDTQLNDRIWKHFNMQDSSWIRKVFEKYSLKLFSRITFRTWIHSTQTDPLNTRGQFETLSGFLRNFFFRKKNKSAKVPEIFLDTKPETNTSYSLGAPLLG